MVKIMAYSKYKSVYSEGSLDEAKASKMKTGKGVKKPSYPPNMKPTTPKIAGPSGKGKAPTAGTKYSNKVKSTTPKIAGPSGKSSKKKKKLRKEEVDARFFALKRRLKEMIAENPEDEQLHEVYSNLHDMHQDAVEAIDNGSDESEVSDELNDEPEKYSSVPAPIKVRANGEDTEISPTFTDADSDAYDDLMDNSPRDEEFDFEAEGDTDENGDVDYGAYHDNLDVDNYDTLLKKPSKETEEPEETEEETETEEEEEPAEEKAEKTKKEEAYRRWMNEQLRKQMREDEDKNKDDLESEELPSDFTFPSEEDETPHDPNKDTSDKKSDDDFSFEETDFDDADLHTIVKAAQEIVNTVQSASEKEETSEDKEEDSDKEKKEDKEEK